MTAQGSVIVTWNPVGEALGSLIRTWVWVLVVAGFVGLTLLIIRGAPPPLSYVIAVLFGLIGAILLVVSVLVILYELRQWRETGRFLRNVQNETWLVAQHRRGWREYIQNNLFACLTPGVRRIWRGSREYHLLRESLINMGCASPILRRPFAVRFRRREVELLPLHEALFEMKTFGRTSREVQDGTRSVLRGIDHVLVDG